MKYKRFLNIIIFIYFCAYCMMAYAFNDEKTHPDLTEAAIAKSNLDGYLITNIGFSEGVKKVFKGPDINSYFREQPVIGWLREGSTDEDKLNICRASNHFHNPIFKATKPDSADWLESQMSDSLIVDTVCGNTKRYSAVTWATGFKSPLPTDYIGARTGQYLDLYGLRDAPQDMGWDAARVYLYKALTLTDPAAREEQFVRTFKAVGQVMHMLQDMAVPAHVRNDMTSHLVNGSHLGYWGSNRFEKYVVTHSDAIYIDSNPFKPTFAPPMRHTDFWDKDVYTGANPSNTATKGLAEYVNANYFSEYTVFASRYSNSDKHFFPYPRKEGTDIQNYFNDTKAPESVMSEDGKTVKGLWISKVGEGETISHLVRVGPLAEFAYTVLGEGKSFYDALGHDEIVYKDYADRLLPRAVGYSAALLDYFFRGKIEVKQVSTSGTTLKITAKNTTTNGDAMTGGTLDLVIRYRQMNDPNQLFNIIPLTDYQYIDVKLPGSNYTIDSTAKEFTFDLSATPIPSWANDVTAFLVYHGQLGNEDDAVAVGQTVLKTIPRKMTLSLPADGVYGDTDGSDGFTQISVAATANIPGLDLSDGLIELVLLYRISDSDPLQGARVETSPANPTTYYYIRASEETGKKVLTQGQKTELTFDISANPLPIWASDVYMYISYKKAGDPDSMSRAVGYIDISEPTPIDVFNNADKICMNNQWYNAGSPEAIAIVDTNHDGIAQEVDVYLYNIANIFFKASPIGADTPASDTDYTFSAPEKLLGGSFKRLGYILTDYFFDSNFIQDWVDGPSFWGNWTTAESNTATAVKHQTDPDGSYTSPNMQTIRRNKIWWGTGIIYDLHEYPDGSSTCSWDAL